MERTFLSLASLSAACCVYILGCRETLARLVAWGKEESAHDRLGSATSLLARVPCAFDGGTVVMAWRKDKASLGVSKKESDWTEKVKDRLRHGVFCWLMKKERTGQERDRTYNA